MGLPGTSPRCLYRLSCLTGPIHFLKVNRCIIPLINHYTPMLKSQYKSEWLPGPPSFYIYREEMEMISFCVQRFEGKAHMCKEDNLPQQPSLPHNKAGSIRGGEEHRPLRNGGLAEGQVRHENTDNEKATAIKYKTAGVPHPFSEDQAHHLSSSRSISQNGMKTMRKTSVSAPFLRPQLPVPGADAFQSF